MTIIYVDGNNTFKRIEECKKQWIDQKRISPLTKVYERNIDWLALIKTELGLNPESPYRIKWFRAYDIELAELINPSKILKEEIKNDLSASLIVRQKTFELIEKKDRSITSKLETAEQRARKWVRSATDHHETTIKKLKTQLEDKIPNFELVQGGYLKLYPNMQNAKEKGVDVNMAIHCINDIYSQEVHKVILLSNDGDFASLLQKLKVISDVKIEILHLGVKNISQKLRVHADKINRVDCEALFKYYIPD